ncbi:hypothetical protein EMIHUDRAFT_196678 [Emiliania huxleyi CCMP1516]|uniref:Uncharacterized protein n=2 Tax=Emiliania huxleyi TaxID=2903 RepID=A0A0D3J4I7_EMIH1|nr:hypothetical protein EMIHUDRAFT_196678 [Emiliania huxleyi CCMP1516]EOD18422.1 hypothetical protein EMIHUDRAFT_196678 [Emiliania huxleyi CCMP1516]|eukprot:XP_005770851.1 hypothetical protein EMIHUDRAFT_196678 [Emiliania huxleyi CCMP1516]
MQGSLRLQPILGISRARHMVEFTGLASRVRSFEPSRGGGQRSGLKVVVENVNVYEGQYMRVERVVPDERGAEAALLEHCSSAVDATRCDNLSSVKSAATSVLPCEDYVGITATIYRPFTKPMVLAWEVIWLPRERPNSSTSSDDGASKSAFGGYRGAA